MTTFFSENYPSLTIHSGELALKFTGGQYEAEDEETADAVRAFASTFPQYGILEGGAPPDGDLDGETGNGTDETGDEPGEIGSELNVEELRDELRARDLPVSGNRDELLERLAASDGDDSGESTDDTDAT